MGEGEYQSTVTFNLGIEWNMKISRRVDQAVEAYLNGDLPKWFFNLKAIKFLIVGYLDDKERDLLINMEKELSTLLQYIKSQPNKRNEVASAIEKYDNLIKLMLNSKGFLNPMKKDTSILYGQD